MDLFERARAWMREDPDPDDRAELGALVDRDDEAALAERFSGPLQFGTAGLRGLIGAGESRMNTAVIARATWGLCRYVLDTIPGAAARGIVIGRDARRRSDAFAETAAEVAKAAGLTVYHLPGPAPTPLVAYAARERGTAAGVVVTASHNPPDYNGYKVYLDDAAQIVPPHDANIAAHIASAPGARDIARAPAPFATLPAIEDHYVEAVAALATLDVPRELSIAYTAMHGVGERILRRALDAAGFRRVFSVAEQAEPDGEFPTVRFPNPEEPGALDLVLALAKDTEAELVLANDPDADRLAVAVPDGKGDYVALSGNEIGVLLGHHVLTKTPGGAERLVVSTVVSSTQLARIARDLGATHRETLTGFKWIARAALEEEARGARFVFGYEEAIGYSVGDVVRDKDGIGAAVAFAELAADCKAKGESVLERLDAIRRAHGYFFGRQKSLTLPGAAGRAKIDAAMAALRGSEARSLGAERVRAVWDLEACTRRRPEGTEPVLHLPPTDGVIFEIEGGRVAVRPSGTEPKIKLYLEVEQAAPEGAQARLDALLGAVLGLAGLA